MNYHWRACTLLYTFSLEKWAKELPRKCYQGWKRALAAATVCNSHPQEVTSKSTELRKIE